MILVPATSLYAALLAGLFIALSVSTIRARRTARIAIGAGDDPALTRAMRVHANFAEYAPFAIVLLALAELNGTPVLFIHALGLLLVAGRALHAYGVSGSPENFRFRIWGMGTTFGVIAASAIVNIFAGFGFFCDIGTLSALTRRLQPPERVLI